jgi:hypothetical protein
MVRKFVPRRDFCSADILKILDAYGLLTRILPTSTKKMLPTDPRIENFLFRGHSVAKLCCWKNYSEHSTDVRIQTTDVKT